MNLPNRFIHQTFRYCLGRRSYAVSEMCDWIIKNIDNIPKSELNIIKNDLDWGFKSYKDNLLSGNTEEEASMYAGLGSDIDRRSWEDVYDAVTIKNVGGDNET